MAMEPISSMVRMQQQTYTPVQPAEIKADKVEGDASSSTKAAEKVDQTINVVQNSNSKGNSQSEDQQNLSQNDNEQLRKAVEQMQKNMPNSEAVFGFHEGTNRVTIKLVDKKTKEVIKELPPEKTLDMIAKVWEMAGILVDEKR